VLVCIADRERHSGHYVASNQLYERAIQIVRPMQAHQRLGAVLNNFAINVFNQAQLDRAERVFREALQNFQAVGDQHNTGVALANIADILALRGRLDEAATMYHKAWESTEMALPQPGYAHYRYALARLMQGRPEEAFREAELSVEACRKLNKPDDVAGGLVVVGNIQMAKGDLVASRRSYEEALETQTKLGNLDDGAETKYALADLALAEGNPEKGEALVREAIAQLEKGQNILDHIAVYTTLSRVLQAEGKLEDASKAIDHAAELVGANDLKNFPGVATPVRIQQARVTGSLAATDAHGQPKVAAARTDLMALAAAARRLGLFSFECDARTALGEFEMKTNPDTGRQHLASLAVYARDHGFALIATRATALQNLMAAQARSK